MLEEAFAETKKAKQEAEILGDDYLMFKADLLRVQNQMSGWYDIFFMVKDIAIEDSLLEQLIRYDYRNHLAHVYIYAYDNRPEVVARAYRSEAAVVYFGKGIALIYTVRMYQSFREWLRFFGMWQERKALSAGMEAMSLSSSGIHSIMRNWKIMRN